jgi:hypothetical protein
MSTTSPHSDKRTDLQPSQQHSRNTSGPRHNPLGVDTTGAHHYWNRHTATILVIQPDGTIQHREALDAHADKTVTDWVDYVATERGWQTCKVITLSARDLAAASQ